MSADKRADPQVALFLFAHQDDEFGVYRAITAELDEGRKVICAYLTDGGFGGASPERRNRESLAVLTRLGVDAANILFAGCQLGVHDGSLPERAATCADWIREQLAAAMPIAGVYVPAWEGGHQDHDALHAVVAEIAGELGVISKLWQFPLYNGFQRPGALFRVFHPLPQNGPVTAQRIGLRDKLRFLRCCLSYPSQTKTWLGLFPLVLVDYLTRGRQVLQPVSAARVSERPHEGKLYYERRGFYTWREMEHSLGKWRGHNKPETTAR